MKRLFLTAIVLGIAGCATYEKTVMNPWLGAPEGQLVSAWGYPSASTDIVTINAQTKVYTYRYNTSDAWSGAPTACRVSFTLKDGVVDRYEYSGASCPRNARQ